MRAKRLGIIGYGNIGSQLSVIASGLGMHVYYYDIEAKLRHGNARPVGSLDELLGVSDVVTLHVPATPQTERMIDRAAIAKMKRGAVLINHARGNLIEIDALADALRSGHLAGAAIDVFPVEPSSSNDEFVSPLRALDNVILTPHIGGSTQEAQAAIGAEVSDKLIAYARDGVTAKAVNFPEVSLPPRREGIVRVAHTHQNVPGVLTALNEVFSGAGLNICQQGLATSGSIGYVLTDVDGAVPDDFAAQLTSVSGTLRARVLGSSVARAVAAA